MAELHTIPTEALEAELERRKAEVDGGPPAPLQNPDFSRLRELVTSGVITSWAVKYQDEDFQHYVYEEAINAIFGPAYWGWRRRQNW